jgi:benzoyl-CoA reductase subunit C
MLAVMSLPVAEAIALVTDAIAEAKTRASRLAPNRPRLLVYGSELDNPALFDQLEQAGAHVVIEDLCVGSKTWLHDVPIKDDLLAGLADYYLDRITCPRTFRGSHGTGRNLDVRFQYLRDLAADYRVNGAVLYILMYCDTFEFDVPDVKDYLEAAGVPCLHLEDDYRLSNLEAIKTRVEAFLEVIGRR